MKKLLSFILACVVAISLFACGEKSTSMKRNEYKEGDAIVEAIPLKYDGVDDFSEGLACVCLNYKWGYIDKTGKEVIPLKYDFGKVFSEGFALVRLDDKYGYIDKTGKEVMPLKYDFGKIFSEGLALVSLDDKYGYIDKTGKEVVSLKYGFVGDFSEGLALVSLDDKYGYIDKTGKEVILLKYDDAGKFSEGLACVCLNYKWGYIDKTGKEVMPLKYESGIDFSEGFAAVYLNGKWGSISYLPEHSTGNNSNGGRNGSTKNKKTEFGICQQCDNEKQCYNVIFAIDGEIRDGGTVCEDCLKLVINNTIYSGEKNLEVIFMDNAEEIEKLEERKLDTNKLDEERSAILSELRKTKVVENY